MVSICHRRGVDPGREPRACRLHASKSHRTFRRTAIGKELGKLNLALDLRCLRRHYEGELVTPVGVYIVKTGDFAGGELRLRLEAGADSVEVRAKPERDPVLDWVLQQK